MNLMMLVTGRGGVASSSGLVYYFLFVFSFVLGGIFINSFLLFFPEMIKKIKNKNSSWLRGGRDSYECPVEE